MSTRNIWLWFFVLLKFTLQYFAIDSVYELHRDEYLHLDLGKHLAWGYLSVPPVTAWISWLIGVLGNSIFWVKFFPALFGVLTMVVVWKTIEFLKGNLFALILGATCITFSALLRINTLYQPNSLEFLMWTLVFYIIIRYLDSGDRKWLYIGAVAFAIGFLNKYNITFLILGLLPAILLSRHRNMFVNKHFYQAVLLALILVSLNLIWQFNNDFPVLFHLKELSEKQLVNVNRLDFLKEQLLFFTGSLFVIVFGFISFFRHSPLKKYQVFFWSYIFTIAIYVFLKAKGYYAIGLYPVLITFGSVYLEKLTEEGWRRYLRPVAILIPLLILWPIYSFILPVLTPGYYYRKIGRISAVWPFKVGRWTRPFTSSGLCRYARLERTGRDC